MNRVLISFFLAMSLTACDGGFKANDETDTDTDSTCEDGVNCPEDCGDNVDNDGDGAIDCADSDCSGLESCIEDCYDGVDNDGDSFIDCDDADCAGQCDEDCTDGEDNDGDGAVDCDDSDCDGDCPEVCDDGRDNDGDGDIDCEDTDCDGSCPEVCDDGRDNDGDGDIDCEDSDCEGDTSCGEDCTDGVDNDGDGLIDCEDGDCADFEGCLEDCEDGVDNDGDGLADCMDDDCWGRTDCHPDGVNSVVQGGSNMDVNSVFKGVTVYNSTCASYGRQTSINNEGVGYSIYGTLTAKPRGATDFVTCNWTVGTVSFSHQKNRTYAGGAYSSTSSSTFGPVTRNNVYVEPGCAVSTAATWFLPQKLRFDYAFEAVLTESGGAWYQGYTTNTYTSTSNYSSTCNKYSFSWSGTYTISPIGSAVSSYLAYE